MTMWRLVAGLLALTTAAGCRRPDTAQPADPMLEAIRAEERAAGATDRTRRTWTRRHRT